MHDRRVEIISGYEVRRNTIPDYKSEEFAECLDMWTGVKQTEMMPFAGGFLEQPGQVWDVIRLFNRLSSEWEAAEHDRRRTENSSPGRGRQRR